MSIAYSQNNLEIKDGIDLIAPRILIIDDNADIHQDFTNILASPEDASLLNDIEQNLFGDDAAISICNNTYTVEHAYQGEEGLRKTLEAHSLGHPFMVAFVDMRMPPGWDGLETIEWIWQVDPDMQVVICTAYSDYSWEQITERLGRTDKLLLLKKPFDVAEIAQLTSTLVEKWTLHHKTNLMISELDAMVNIRTQELEQANKRLRQEITERKRVEEEIKQMNHELMAIHDELRRVNRDLEEKVEERTAEVRGLLKQKEEFIAQLAHDLRTPLTPLVSLIPLLREEQLGTKSEELFDVIGRNVNYMKDLVEKTVSLAQLNSVDVALDMVEVNLLGLVRDFLRSKGNHFDQNQITVDLRIEEGITIVADALQLEEVLHNLTANAIKFMPDGGTLTFEAGAGNEFVTLSIRDTGIGLTEDQKLHVFEEFYQVDPSRHQTGSAGLGLTICRRIIEKLGGTIWVESEGLDKGTTFSFTVPTKMKDKSQSGGGIYKLEATGTPETKIRDKKRNLKANQKS